MKYFWVIDETKIVKKERKMESSIFAEVKSEKKEDLVVTYESNRSAVSIFFQIKQNGINQFKKNVNRRLKQALLTNLLPQDLKLIQKLIVMPKHYFKKDFKLQKN